MARIARIVVPGEYHHISQWGNRSQNVFFSEQDKKYYLKHLDSCTREAGITLYAYCLMDNHVHLIAMPKRQNSFSLGLGKLHRLYTNMINSREGWRGHLWQGRFMSYPLDSAYLYEAIIYVERTPIRRGVVRSAQEYIWSSALRRLGSTEGPKLAPLDNRVFAHIPAGRNGLHSPSLFKRHSLTGRPLGDKAFIDKIKALTGRDLTKKKPGPKHIE
jgi:putative transposase